MNPHTNFYRAIVQLAGKASKILFAIQASGGPQVVGEKVSQHSQKLRKQCKTIALILIWDHRKFFRSIAACRNLPK